MDNIIGNAFVGEYSPGIYQLEAKTAVDELSRLFEEQGFRFFYLDGKDVVDKDTFLKRTAEVMDFPDYFGNNWDAFNDCITDLEWYPANKYILLYDQFENFAQSAPSEWNVALDILRSAVEYWKEMDIPMYVLLRGNEAALAGLPVFGIKK